MSEVRIVVAGHVDHGKSTLIGRLLYDTGSLPQQVADNFGPGSGPYGAAALAFVTDQLSEEQEGSFTLDTTQAHLRMARRDYTLIDTPGHQEFLKNMVTGTTRADAALLVVDAAEGPLPQTYLHAYLIALLGIRQMILVINKMDLVAYDRGRFQFLAHHLSHHLQRIGIPPVAVIPISAQQGDHLVRPSDRMPWNSTHTVVETMEELLAQEEEECQPLRFLVQCLFPGMGRQAILGKVASGALQRGQAILFHPGVHRTVVTAVLLGEQEAPGAAAGESVGLLLEDALPVKRGQIGSDVDHSPWVTDRLPVKMFWIHPQPLEVRDRIEVLCGTQTRKACVEAITRVIDPVSLTAMETEATRLKDSQVAEAVLRTDTPICIDPFDIVPELGRFAILRRGRIVGGGVIAE